MVLIAVLAVCLSANGQTNEYYYLRNVGTGKWLGPGNFVGVQASLTDVAYWVKFQNANNGQISPLSSFEDILSLNSLCLPTAFSVQGL